MYRRLVECLIKRERDKAVVHGVCCAHRRYMRNRRPGISPILSSQQRRKDAIRTPGSCWQEITCSRPLYYALVSARRPSALLEKPLFNGISRTRYPITPSRSTRLRSCWICPHAKARAYHWRANCTRSQIPAASTCCAMASAAMPSSMVLNQSELFRLFNQQHN